MKDWGQGALWSCYGQAEAEGGPDEGQKQHPPLRRKVEEAPGGQVGPGTALVLRPAPWRPGQTESDPEFGAGQRKDFGKGRWMRTFGLRFWVMKMVGAAVR